MRATPAIALGLERGRARFSDYLELTKPRLNFLVLATTAAGFYLGSAPGFNLPLLLHTLLGTALVAASAAALNQHLERDADAKMGRTRRRPLPAGRLVPSEALWFGLWTGLAGVVWLVATVHLYAAMLAGFTWLCYLFWYTPLKTSTPWNTVVGAIPGALPPVIGWVAARGALGGEALVLFAILFFWQFPHFFSLAWLYRDDYVRGGFRMLAGEDPGGRRSAAIMSVAAVALWITSLLPTVLGVTGLFHAGTATVLGFVFLALNARCLGGRLDGGARRVFLASVIYLPLLLATMVLDKR